MFSLFWHTTSSTWTMMACVKEWFIALPSTWISPLRYDIIDQLLLIFNFKQVNAGVGGYLSELETDGEGNLIQEYKVGRIFYDNLYNIFVAIILVNIVSGIIIDTFGSLREKENDKN